MDSMRKSRIIYEAACKILDEMHSEAGITDSLEKYYRGDNPNPESLENVFRNLIISAQNRQGMPRVIKFHDREHVIQEILFYYDINQISQKGADYFLRKFNVQKNRLGVDTFGKQWSQWCKAIFDSANFLNQFTDINDFTAFVESFQQNLATRIALPLYLQTKIYGIGFALACDFLKELNYQNYLKPDTHIVYICKSLELIDTKADGKNEKVLAFEAIDRLARDVEQKPYKVDKILWLISSGKFYKDRDENSNPISIHPRRDVLVDRVKGLI